MIAIPNAPHAYGYAMPYLTRRRWDYFVRYLARNIPPKHFALKPWPWNRASATKADRRLRTSLHIAETAAIAGRPAMRWPRARPVRA